MEDAQHEPPPRGLEAITAYFRRRRWPFVYVDRHSLAFSRPTQNGSLACRAWLEDHLFAFRSRYPFNVPEGKRLRFAQFAALANYRTPVGALDLDLTDGEVGFRTGVDVARDELTPGLVAAVVEANLVAADRWLPGAAAVCFSDIAPQAAIRQCTAAATIADVVALACELLSSGEE